MFRQGVTVHFTDQATEPAHVVLTQWSIGQFAQYAAGKGWKVDPAQPGMLAVTMLRFQAFAELHRDPNRPRPTFDKWDQTVDEVEPDGDPEAVDPTGPAPSDG